MIPKNATYRQQLVKCGKPKCRRCRRGPAHGPYWFAEWREKDRSAPKKARRGKLKTKYVGRFLPLDVARSFDGWAPRTWAPKSNFEKVRSAAVAELALRDGFKRLALTAMPMLDQKPPHYLCDLECHHAVEVPARAVTFLAPKRGDFIRCPECAREQKKRARRS
jgi:hypothetical protein